MAAAKTVNPKAKVARAQAALAFNISAARGLQDLLRTNLGPKGTIKILVSGAGDIKLTKDTGQIQHPTASLIAKVATAQDDIIGDGTTSNVLIIGELLKQADLYISEGLHPRIITEGFEAVKEKALHFLEEVKVSREMDKETLKDVARASLCSKVHAELADVLTEAVVGSILAIKRKDEPTDLFMIFLIRGLVLDHRERVEDAYILTCNVEVNSGFFLQESERKFIEDRVKTNNRTEKENKGFINQKGIDPFSLDALSKEGIVALHRAKRRNMERLTLACGGVALNSFEDLSPDCLGHAGLVYEYTLLKFRIRFLEKCNNPRSVTLLIKGPNKAVKNAIDDGCIVPGAGAVEVAMAEALIKYKLRVKDKAQLGVQAFVDASLVIPKVLAQNSGFDLQETLLVGVDLNTGKRMQLFVEGKLDVVHVTLIATNILLVDEIMQAGMSSLKG
uniref:T-complex protein 1 subunit zeta n=1 Tax=Nomascus leucogenys TaxID=61853 RepID=A0A2I3GE62_NOMLE